MSQNPAHAAPFGSESCLFSNLVAYGGIDARGLFFALDSVNFVNFATAGAPVAATLTGRA